VNTGEWALAGACAPIALEALGDAALLDRVDTKYLMPRAMLGAVLAACASSYRRLAVAGRRGARYRTTYFDTPSHALYRAHLSGRAVRQKVRVREYLDSQVAFFEIKARTHTGRTRKWRVPIMGGSTLDLPGLLARYRNDAQAVLPWTDPLVPTVATEFSRVTLVSERGDERITIDFDLTFRLNHESVGFPNALLVERKASSRHSRSVFADWVRGHGIRASRVSKYCLGVASLCPTLPSHRFRPVLARIARLELRSETAADHSATPVHA